MSGVDYYEFEWTTTPLNPASWAAMPPAASGDFDRTYLEFSPFGFHSPTFSAQLPIDGRHVYETIQHYEADQRPGRLGQRRSPLAGLVARPADGVADGRKLRRRHLLSAREGLEHRRRRPPDQSADPQDLREHDRQLRRAAGGQPHRRRRSDRSARQPLRRRHGAHLHQRAGHRHRRRRRSCITTARRAAFPPAATSTSKRPTGC